MDNSNEEINCPGVEETLKKRREDKLYALCWIILSSVLFYSTNFFPILFYSSDTYFFFITWAEVFFLLFILAYFYLNYYLLYILHITMKWENYRPMILKVSTFFFFSSYFLFVIGFWPIWDLLTPILIAIYYISILMLSHFIPSKHP